MLETLIQSQALGRVVGQHLFNQVKQLLVVFVAGGHVTLKEKDTFSI